MVFDLKCDHTNTAPRQTALAQHSHTPSRKNYNTACLHEDILEGDTDACAGSDDVGTLGLGGQAVAEQRNGVVPSGGRRDR